MSVILFIIVLFILVLVHEFGHFIVAKKSGIKVDEFGFGFPPRVLTLFTKGETKYTLNLIPFGGFVKIFGENPDEASISGPEASRSLIAKPKYIQAAVLFAGVFFNLLLAWFLLSVGFMSGMPTSQSAVENNVALQNPELMIIEVLPDSPAEKAELKIGDIITKLSVEEDAIEGQITPVQLQDFIKVHGSNEITFEYNRGDVAQSTKLTPVLGINGATPAIGIGMDTIGLLKLPIHKAIIEGAKSTAFITWGTVKGFYTLIRDAVTGVGSLDAVTGPVGIVKIVGDAYDIGFIYLLSFTALISINLAVINLMPFPALDGGRLLFLLIEKIKGSRINPKVANILNAVGFFILIGLMLIVTYRDVVKLF